MDSKASTIITAFTRHQLSIDISFNLLYMKYDIKIQNAAIIRFLRKKSYILSQGHSVFRRNFFLAVCLSKGFTKVQEVVFATSL